MNNIMKKLLSLFLALVLCISMMPVQTFADDGAEIEPPAEEIQPEEQIPAEEQIPEDSGHVHEYVFVEEIPATEESDGVKAHYICSSCDSLFILADGEYVEVTADELVIPKPVSTEDPAVPEEDEKPGEQEEAAPDETELEASLATSGTCEDGLSWSLDNHVLTISGTGSMMDYEETVTPIDEDNEWYMTSAPWGQLLQSYEDLMAVDIQSVVIGPGITSVGAYAFGFISTIQSVSIPEGVTSIGNCAFVNAGELGSVTIPSSVTSIGDDVFLNCEGLTNLTICPGSSALTIGTYAFLGCKGIKDLTIPDNVSSIGYEAFYGCSSLATVRLGSGITNIGTRAFYSNNSSLSNVLYNGTAVDWSAVTVSYDNDILTNALRFRADSGSCGEGSGLCWFLSDTGALIISGIGAMPDYGWSEDNKGTSAPWGESLASITSAVICPGVTYIGIASFLDCINLSSVSIGPDVQEIGDSAFDGCDRLAGVYIPGNVKTIGDESFFSCDNLKDLTIGSGVETIGDAAFGYCSALRNVTIPASVKTIKNDAFAYGCGFISVVIPDTVTSLGNAVFWSDQYLESVVIGSGITVIGEQLFGHDSALTRVTFNGKITEIGDEAFLECDNLEDIYFNGTREEWDAVTIGERNDVLDTVTVHCASNSGVCEDGLSWKVFDGDTLVISVVSGSGAMSNYEETTIDGQTTSTAPWGALSRVIKHVIIENGVTKIGYNAFNGFCELESVSFPEGLTEIGYYAFRWCYSLKSLELPDSLETIGWGAFWTCTSLESVSFGSGLQNILVAAFGKCTALSSACYNGTAAEWALVTIGSDNDALAALAVSFLLGHGSCGENLSWKLSGDGLLTIAGTGDMTDYTQGGAPWYALRESIVSVEILAGVNTIGNYAFCDCTAMESITGPYSVTIIGDYAFYNCTALKHKYWEREESNWVYVTIGSNNECFTEIDLWNIYDSGKCGKNLKWTYYVVCADSGTERILDISGTGDMDNWTDKYPAMPPWDKCHTSFNTIIIESGATSIGSYAFNHCSNVTSVSIPDTVTAIGDSAFAHMSAIKSVTIPDSVTAIGKEAFIYCSGLESVAIPDSVKDIQDNTFYFCTALRELTIGSAVENINYGAFLYCSSLKSVNIPDSVKSIGENAFKWCQALEEVTLGSGVETIGREAFEATRIERIDFPDSLRTIGRSAFYSTNLETVNLNDGLEYIDQFAFSVCYHLKSIRIPGSVKEICWGAFYSDNALTEVIIEPGVLEIGSTAFAYNNCLKSVTIPNTLSEIQTNVFLDCYSITDVYFTGTRAEWDALKKNNYNDALLNATIHCYTDFGSCGTDLSWYLWDDGLLVISGTGTVMDDYIPDDSPLYVYRNSIRKVQLDGSLTHVGNNAFFMVNNIEEVIYRGDESQWNYLEAHSGVGNESLFGAPRKAVAADITLDREYVAVEAGDSFLLNATVTPDWAGVGTVTWKSDNTLVANVDANGRVTTNSMSFGTAVITASVEINGVEYSASCRVDVSENEISASIDGISLNTTKVKSSFFSTDFAELKVLIALNQNISPSLSTGSGLLNKGVTISRVSFTDSTTRDYYELRIADDRTIQLVPENLAIEEGIANPKSIPSKLKSSIIIVFRNSDGFEWSYTSDVITISINKKVPTIKAKTVTLNSYYEGYSAPIVFSGGKVTGIKLNGEAPEWVGLHGDNGVALTKPVTKASGKLKLYATVEGWDYLFPVTVNVKAKYSAPSLSLKVKGYIDTAVSHSSVTVTMTLKNSFGPVDYNCNITDSTGANFGSSFQIMDKGGVFELQQLSTPLAAGKYSIAMHADVNGDGIDDITKNAKFTVKASNPAKLKQSVTLKAAGYIDLVRPDSAVILTPVFKNYASYNPTVSDLTFKKLVGKTWTTVSLYDLPFEFSLLENGFMLKASPGASLSASDKYRVEFTDQNYTHLSSKQVAIKIKLGKGSVKADKKEITLFRKDMYCYETINLTPGSGLNRISKIEVKGTDANFLMLTPVGGSATRWRLGFKGGNVLTKTKTVTLNIWFEGNNTSKPSTTVKIKVNIA